MFKKKKKRIECPDFLIFPHGYCNIMGTCPTFPMGHVLCVWQLARHGRYTGHSFPSRKKLYVLLPWPDPIAASLCPCCLLSSPTQVLSFPKVPALMRPVLISILCSAKAHTQEYCIAHLTIYLYGIFLCMNEILLFCLYGPCTFLVNFWLFYIV